MLVVLLDCESIMAYLHRHENFQGFTWYQVFCQWQNTWNLVKTWPWMRKSVDFQVIHIISGSFVMPTLMADYSIVIMLSYTLLNGKILEKKLMWLLEIKNCAEKLMFNPSLMIIQSSAVITRSNFVRYFINNYRNWCRISISCLIH